MQVWTNWWLNSLLEGWPTCSQEVVEVHHHVHSRVQERSKATLPSSNKPDIVQINEINGRSHLICYLGPHQQRRGRVPWWITWRGDRWVNFFRATKNIESARSINWKNNKRIELEKKSVRLFELWAWQINVWVGMVCWITVRFLLGFGLGHELDDSLPLRSSTTMRGWGPSWPGDLCHNPQVGRPSCTLLSCRNPSPGGKCPVIYKFSLWKLYL